MYSKKSEDGWQKPAFADAHDLQCARRSIHKTEGVVGDSVTAVGAEVSRTSQYRHVARQDSTKNEYKSVPSSQPYISR